MRTDSVELPPDPVGFIKSCVGNRRVLWTYHANMRLDGRSVTRGQILGSADSYEIVEAYPEDKYLPSYLILADHPTNPVHVLFATDVAGENVRVVTAYRPHEDEWECDLKTRRLPR